MKVSDILANKDSRIYSVTGQSSVYDALQLMSEKNIGALIIMDGGRLAGILSERDYARKIVLKGRSSHDTLVKEIMTENVVTVTPEDPIEKCMELMSSKRFRHLPVVEDTKVIGMIAIGDVLNAIIETQKETIEQLHQYISQ